MRVGIRVRQVALSGLIALAVTWCGLLPSSHEGLAHRSSLRSLHLAKLPCSSLYSDLDGDQRLDQAELFSNGIRKSIRVSLGSSAVSDLSFDSPTTARGSLLAVDIDHDRDMDLVWISGSQPLAAVVWLGDGRGHFEVAKNAGQYFSELGSVLSNDENASLGESRARTDPACLSTPHCARDLALLNSLAVESPSSIPRACPENRRAFKFCLASVRKRGPPSILS